MAEPSAADAEDPRLILLDPRDNVLVVRRRIAQGDPLTIGSAVVSAAREIPMAHKVARRAIAAGEKVLKYGAPIGTATAAIAMGEHVHIHNVKSDYTPTYVVDAPSNDAKKPEASR